MSPTTHRIALSLTLLALVGCKGGYTRPLVPIDSAAGMYEKARVSYEVDAGEMQVPVSVAKIEGQLVSYQQVPSSLQAGETLGRLEIEYPHPRGLNGYALARVTVESSFAGKEGQTPSKTSKLPVVGAWTDPRTKTMEVWELDIPRSEFDRIVAALNQARYFDRSMDNPGPVSMAAKIDGNDVDKKWNRVAELDGLMVAVRGHGRLVTYNRTPTTDEVAGPVPKSVAAYRAYSAHDASFGPSPNAYVSSGYTLPGVSANPASGYGMPTGTMIANQPAPYGAPRVGQNPAIAQPVR